MRHQKTATDVSIPIHPIVRSIYEKYNWELPDLVSNQNINPYIKESVKLAKINNIIIIDRIEGGKRKKYKFEKHELVGTHSGRRSFCTNMYLRKIPIYQIMAVSGHKTEKSFLRYIKVKPKEYSELMSKEWDNIYYPQANVEINSPDIIQLQELIETLKGNELSLKSQILDLINEKEQLNNDFLELRKKNIKTLIELREFKELNI